MPRVDRYDIIGMVLLAFVAALWILHFSLPTPSPDNYRALGNLGVIPAHSASKARVNALTEPGLIRRS
jgi:hypothetical protein